MEKGMYCRHGKRIMVPETDEEYSAFVFADPYPCNRAECSKEEVQKEAREEEEAYWKDLSEEMYRLQGGY